LDPQGNPCASWVWGSNIYYSYWDSSWAPPDTIILPVENVSPPSMVVDTTDTVHLVFTKYYWLPSDIGDLIYCKFPREDFDTSACETLLTDNFCVMPSLALYESGNVHLLWQDNSPGNWEVYKSEYDDTAGTWTAPENISNTLPVSAYPHSAYALVDSATAKLYCLWTDGDTIPYTIDFKKIDASPVARTYVDLGQEIQSLYCLERDGYWIFGDKPYESVDYDNDSLVYKFTDLDPAKEYRLDLAYYVENPQKDTEEGHGVYSPSPLPSPIKGEGIIDCTSLIKGRGMSEKVSATNYCSDLKCPTDEIISPPAADRSDHAGDESGKGIGRLIQALVIDGIRLDSAFIVPHKLIRASIWLPNELYSDGEITTEIKKIKGKVVVCGEISLYEFGSETDMGSIANITGGPQNNETTRVDPIFFEGLYPNPAKGDLKIKFNLPNERKLTVKLYDVTGRLISEIFNGRLKIGTNEIPIRSNKLTAGIYFIRIKVGEDTITEKIIILK
jgi:hypothetical protein